MTEQTVDQAPTEQSIEDRIYAKFNPEEEQETPQVEAEAEAEVEAEPESDDVEVELEGSRYRVPKALEKHLMLNADYTQKTQKIADQARLLEQSQSAMKLAQMEREFETETHESVQQLQAIDQWMKSLNNRDFTQMSSDEKLDVMFQIRKAEGIRDELRDSLKAKRTEFDSKMAKTTDEVKAKAREALEKLVPGYKPESFGQVRDYAKSLGFTDVAIDSIEMDAKSALVLYKAQQFDALQANKKASVEKVAAVVKPGSSNPMPQNVKDKLALNKAFKNAKSKGERDAIMQKRVEAMF